jgi:cytochrome c6
MKKTLAGLVVLGLLAGAGAAFAEDAAKLYGIKCAMCHGKDAKGNPGMAKKFGADALNLLDEASLAKTDEDLVKVTLEGEGKPGPSGAKPMPAFKGKIKDEDAKALAAYVRGLAPKK